MKLDYRFYRLPIQVDNARLLGEVNAIDSDQWIDHPDGFTGNSALSLISVDGKDNHGVSGQMMACPRTKKMPYLMQVIAALETTIGRTRLMRLDAGHSVPEHCDINLYWRKRMRVHIPIITNSSVIFESGGQAQHMATGEAWVMDTWHKHSVVNHGGERIHLVIDTLGSPNFWALINNRAWKPSINQRVAPNSFTTKDIKYHHRSQAVQLDIEENHFEPVIRPSEIDDILHTYLDDLDHIADPNDRESPKDILHSLSENWRNTWSKFGTNAEHHIRYRLLVLHTTEKLQALKNTVKLQTNQQDLIPLITQFLQNLSNQKFDKIALSNDVKAKSKIARESVHQTTTQSIRTFKPVFIVAAPRSGSTLLYETLGCHEQLVHYDAESHQIIESIPSLNIASNDSNHLNIKHATVAVSNQLKQHFINSLGQQISAKDSQVTFIEKTPKNALRIEFLKTAFPNARFIYLHRQPQHNVSSIIDGWKSGRFVTYQHLDGWNSKYPWSFLLPEGWRDLPPNDLAGIASYQYRVANQSIIDELIKMKNGDAMSLSYEGFVQNPEKYLRKICNFINLPWSQKFDVELQRDTGLRYSKYTLTQPSEHKWLENQSLLKQVLPELQNFYGNQILTSDKLINSKP